MILIPSPGSLLQRGFLLGLLFHLGSTVAGADDKPTLLVYLAEPGVYAISHADMSHFGAGPFSVDRFRLSFQGTPIPLSIDEGADGNRRLDPDERLVFVASRDRLWSPSLQHTSPLVALRLELAPLPETAPDDTAPDESSNIDRHSEGEPGPVHRLLHFEQDRIRVPVTLGTDLEGLDTLWFWADLHGHSSTSHTVEVGDLPDLDRAAGPAQLRVRLLGWSTPPVPSGETQHQVDVRLNGQRIGTARWNGRTLHELHLDAVSVELLRSTGNRLELDVPSRRSPGADEPIIDWIYVDQIELRYPVKRPASHGAAPLYVPVGSSPQRLAGGAPGDLLVSAQGGPAERREGDGWTLAATDLDSESETDQGLEVWIVAQSDLRRPLKIRPPAPPPELRSRLDYVMIAPTELLPGARRLAELHRNRGLSVAVVDAGAIDDAYGWGRRSPQAIRSFLDTQLAHSPGLRFVLLIGDADWFTVDDLEPDSEQVFLPSGTFFSRSGPAASDHVFAQSEHDVVSPRFAVGRLPVRNVAALERWIHKIERYLGTDEDTISGTDLPQVLLASDQSSVSIQRFERLRRSLSAAPAPKVAVPSTSPERPLDDQLIEAFEPMPDVVLFSGHGSRHTWQLGIAHGVAGGGFFEREDVERLPDTERPPVILSVSCATAPFDHPSADSLGEIFLDREDGGAIAFLGASARLYTQPRFGELIVRGLVNGLSIGEAMVAAKKQVGSRETSALYNLLGDPALIIR